MHRLAVTLVISTLLACSGEASDPELGTQASHSHATSGFCATRGGTWCDGSDVVECRNGQEVRRQTCAHGCQSMPRGTPDQCRTPPTCTDGCDLDFLVACQAGAEIRRTLCTEGCAGGACIPPASCSPPSGSCLHTYGGVYADGGCSASYQCCAGAWARGVGSCGTCTCTDPSGTTGCAVPVTSCTHSFGGLYAEGGCSASYQCCGGAWVRGTGTCGACACTETTGTVGCTVPSTPCTPAFAGSAVPLPATLRTSMIGSTWHQGCPVPLDDLVLLEMTHWGFDGAIHNGEMIVSRGVAGDVLAAFRAIYDAGFPIERMRLVHHYGGDDDLSMADNNTSAFNCRRIPGSTTFSQHAYGTAIDINPVQNPYVSGSTILPPAGSAYLNRAQHQTGMIGGGPVTAAFSAIGWGWGGNFNSLKDYQHFSQNGR